MRRHPHHRNLPATIAATTLTSTVTTTALITALTTAALTAAVADLACDACALPARLRSASTRAHHTRVARASTEQVIACHLSSLLTPTRVPHPCSPPGCRAPGCCC